MPSVKRFSLVLRYFVPLSGDGVWGGGRTLSPVVNSRPGAAVPRAGGRDRGIRFAALSRGSRQSLSLAKIQPLIAAAGPLGLPWRGSI